VDEVRIFSAIIIMMMAYKTVSAKLAELLWPCQQQFSMNAIYDQTFTSISRCGSKVLALDGTRWPLQAGYFSITCLYKNRILRKTHKPNGLSVKAIRMQGGDRRIKTYLKSCENRNS
jgi:hypothetical protein